MLVCVDGPMKRCSRCRELKPLEAFNKLTRAKDGRQWNCRACNAAWHAENRAHHNALIAKRNVRVLEDNHRRLFEVKLERGCADCGERDPTVLEFDHLRDKKAVVSGLLRYTPSWNRMLEEIDKCEVVCANCHARRTARRANDRRWRLYLEHQERIATLDVADTAELHDQQRTIIRERLAQLASWGRRDSDPQHSD